MRTDPACFAWFRALLIFWISFGRFICSFSFSSPAIPCPARIRDGCPPPARILAVEMQCDSVPAVRRGHRLGGARGSRRNRERCQALRVGPRVASSMRPSKPRGICFVQDTRAGADIRTKRQALRGRYGSRELGAEPARIVRISALIRPRWHPAAFVARLPDASFGKPRNAAGDRRHGDSRQAPSLRNSQKRGTVLWIKGDLQLLSLCVGVEPLSRSPAHSGIGAPRHPKALLVPLCSVCGSALIAYLPVTPKGTRHGQSRSLSAENLHRRIRGPRRYTAGQTANRCSPQFVTASFPDALP